jgi:hypothetical protein
MTLADWDLAADCLEEHGFPAGMVAAVRALGRLEIRDLAEQLELLTRRRWEYVSLENGADITTIALRDKERALYDTHRINGTPAQAEKDARVTVIMEFLGRRIGILE